MNLTDLEHLYPVFRSLPPLLKQATEKTLFRVDAAPGQVLFDTGDPCHAFLLIASGSLRVVQPAPDGRELLLYRLGAGDTCILTVSCLMGAKPYPARGISDTDLVGYALSRELFQQLLSQSETFRHFVFYFFAEKILGLIDLIETLAWSQLDRRLAALLLEKGTMIQTTHQLLANEVGSVREVVSRVLKDLEQKGLVQLGRGQIAILDTAGLEKIARPFGDTSH